jgi:hypothetical protein
MTVSVEDGHSVDPDNADAGQLWLLTDSGVREHPVPLEKSSLHVKPRSGTR